MRWTNPICLEEEGRSSERAVVFEFRVRVGIRVKGGKYTCT